MNQDPSAQEKGSNLSVEPFSYAEDVEADLEKGPVDLFPADATDEVALRRGDLEPGFKARIG